MYSYITSKAVRSSLEEYLLNSGDGLTERQVSLEGALPESGPEVDEARHVAIGEVDASAVGWRRQLLARQRAGAVRVQTMRRVRERVGQRGLRELRQEFGLEQVPCSSRSRSASTASGVTSGAADFSACTSFRVEAICRLLRPGRTRPALADRIRFALCATWR